MRAFTVRARHLNHAVHHAVTEARPEMPVSALLNRLIIAALAANIAMAFCASNGWRWPTGVPAALFALYAIFEAMRVNRPIRESHASTPVNGPALRSTLSETSRVSAMVFLWGGAAMFILYYGVGLSWRHGWQYGASMLLLAAAHEWYARRMLAADPRLTAPHVLHQTAMLATVQALAIALGLVWLILSGKLATVKDDWAANHVFLAGGVAIAALSIIFAASARKADPSR